VTSGNIHAATDSSGNIEPFTPRLLLGETTQGFITAKYLPSREQNVSLGSSRITRLELRNIVYVLYGFMCNIEYLMNFNESDPVPPVQFALAMAWVKMLSKLSLNVVCETDFRQNAIFGFSALKKSAETW
jgi:hypothetical protein